MRLLVASSNSGKLLEFREILQPLLGGAHELLSLADAGLDAPEETGETFWDNALLKAQTAAVQSGLWALGDDSGLCVDALDGGPGVRSARFAPTDAERREKLLRHLAATPANRRGAHFFCAMALAGPDGRRVYRAEGKVTGRIADAPRGSNGFGYDPLFVPDEAPGSTLAELPAAEKNRLSHRGRALARMAPLLAKLLQDGELRD